MGFLGFNDEVADAELLDKGHHSLLCSRANREHGYHGSDAKNHSQHGEQ